MGKYKLLSAALAASASVVALNTAYAANVVALSGWNVTTAVAEDATPANVPGTAPDYTATAPSNPLDLDSRKNATNGYTVAGWLATGGGALLTGVGTHTLDNTLWDITGTVTVTTGETFTVAHDDGLTLTIAGLTVISAPSPTSPATTTATYTGPSGNELFQLVYAECCGPPGVLDVNLPLTTTISEASTWAMMLAGFGGLGFAAMRRSRRTRVSIVGA